MGYYLDWAKDGRDWPNHAASRFVEAASMRWHVQVMGQGPALLLSPSGTVNDWPSSQWQSLPEQVRSKLPDLRVVQANRNAKLLERAAQVSSCDVVLSSDPITTELALLCGMPLVALGRTAADLPKRQGVQGIGATGRLDQLQAAEVLQALGLG